MDRNKHVPPTRTRVIRSRELLPLLLGSTVNNGHTYLSSSLHTAPLCPSLLLPPHPHTSSIIKSSTHSSSSVHHSGIRNIPSEKDYNISDIDEQAEMDLLPSDDCHQPDAATEARATLISMSEPFHGVTLQSSNKMGLDIMYGTGPTTKLTPQTRANFLLFAESCGNKGYHFVERQISGGESKIILEKNKGGRRRASSLRFGQEVAVPASPTTTSSSNHQLDEFLSGPRNPKTTMNVNVTTLTGAVYDSEVNEVINSCKSSSSGATITQLSHFRKVSKLVAPVEIDHAQQDIDSDSDDPDWSILSTTPVDHQYNHNRFSTANSTTSALASATSLCSHTRGVSQNMNKTNLTMPQSPTINLTFEIGEKITLSTEVVGGCEQCAEPSATDTIPQARYSSGQDISDGIIINGEFQATPQGRRASRRGGIYFGTNITSLSALSEVNKPPPVADPEPNVALNDTWFTTSLRMMNARKVSSTGRTVIETETSISEEIMMNHQITIGEMNLSGENPSIDDRMVDVQHRWGEYFEGISSPENLHAMPSTTEDQTIQSQREKNTPNPPVYPLQQTPAEENVESAIGVPVQTPDLMSVIAAHYHEFLLLGADCQDRPQKPIKRVRKFSLSRGNSVDKVKRRIAKRMMGEVGLVKKLKGFVRGSI